VTNVGDSRWRWWWFVFVVLPSPLRNVLGVELSLVTQIHSCLLLLTLRAPQSDRPLYQQTYEFKLVLVGDGGVGKTAFAKKHVTGEFERKYAPTNRIEFHSIDLNTDRGKIRFNVWDTAGVEELAGLGDGYYIDAECAIIMFDVTKEETYFSVPKWQSALERIAGEIPIVLVGNKVDAKDRKVGAHIMNFHIKRNVFYYDVSNRTSYNLVKPLLWLGRKLLMVEKLEIVDVPALPPPVPVMDDETNKAALSQQEEAAAAAAAGPPPDEANKVGGNDDDDAGENNE
jgi:GTP-binding nuclear protein Ran